MADLSKSVKTFVFNGDEDAYPAWAVGMISVLAMTVLSAILPDGGDDVPEEASVKAYHLLELLTLSISLEPAARQRVPNVTAADGGRALWMALRDEYAPSDELAVQSLTKDLFAVRLGPGDKLSDFVKAIDAIRARARATQECLCVASSDACCACLS